MSEKAHMYNENTHMSEPDQLALPLVVNHAKCNLMYTARDLVTCQSHSTLHALRMSVCSPWREHG